MLLSYRYIITEKRESMEHNADYIARFTASYYQQYLSIQNLPYRSYVDSIALISDSYVILANPDGTILYATDGSQLEGYTNAALPDEVVTQVLEEGSYTGMTTLDGLFSESRYLAALPVIVKLGNMQAIQGLVLVSADASTLGEMWSATATIFFFSAVVVLLISVIVSSLTSAYQIRPLNEMAEAAKKFSRGEFDVRVEGYENRGDEIGELAASFNTMAASLEKMDSQRSEFIANVSHELKTPMTTISGFTDGILDGTIPPEKQNEYLQVVSSETKRLARLVRKMLDISKLQSKQNVVGHESFDLCEIMCRMLLSLEGKINDRHLDIDVQMPEEPLKVWGEPDAITQVGYNLMDNAIKFSPPGGVIQLRIAAKDGKAYVTIRNQGPTIPAEELPLIFDRFHKSDKSRSMDKDGVGLGLYIVKTILNNHREQITVTSENGVTAFTFTMTLAR
jgi:signal transduction histidine kinase